MILAVVGQRRNIKTAAYTIDMNQAFNTDCLEAMKLMEDNQYDLAIVDPPYGIGADNMQMGSHPTRKGKDQYPGISTAVKHKNRLNQGSGKLKNRLLNNSDCSWDIPPPLEYFDELFRVSKNQVIWGGNYFNLPPTRCIICWDKVQPWENFSQWEMAWTSYDKPAKMYRISNTGGANKEEKIHPTQKPVILYKRILKDFAEEGFKIIDTHLGSGTSRQACHEMGYDFVGYELSEIRFNDQEKRFQIETAMNSMFNPKEMY